LVNGRPVRDRLMTGAVLRVLRTAGSGFGGAWIVVMLTLPADEVDVNVHPTKAEVRFARPGAVFAILERALRSGVTAVQGEVGVRTVETFTNGFSRPRWHPRGPAPHTMQETASLFAHPAYTGPTLDEHDAPSAQPAAVLATAPAVGNHPGESHRGVLPGTTAMGRLLGQLRSSYLLLEDDEGLLIVDQHAAHERVLYDRVLRRLQGEHAHAQELLEPVVLELDEGLATALPRVTGLLERVGIGAQLFGHDTIRLSCLPSDVDATQAREVVTELLHQASSDDGVPETVSRSLEEALAASLSCRAAVRFNTSLAPAEQEELINDLNRSDNPYRCPHGRPIVIRLSLEELDRRLGRR